jgi:methionyl-tRNA formyltransferase
MRLLFFGSGAFGLPTLQMLQRQHEVLAVVSQPDRPAGRKQQLTPTPIADWARQQGLPTFTTQNVNTPEFVSQIAAFQADASIVIAFGQKLGEPLIAAMGKLAVNLHASLLPAYRGAAPINRAMMDHHTHTGVCVIGLAQRMDAGPVYQSTQTKIDPLETAGELHDRLAALGPLLIARTLHQLTHNTLQPFTQDESRVTLARKLSKQDGTVRFDQPAHLVRATIHGLTPWPGCTVRWIRSDASEQTLMLRRVAALRITGDAHEIPGTVIDETGRIATANGIIQLLELQSPGGKQLAFADFIRGKPICKGDRFEPMSASN